MTHICGEDLGPKGDGHSEGPNDDLTDRGEHQDGEGGVSDTMMEILERSKPTSASDGDENGEADD